LVRRHELETAGSSSRARVSAASESSGIASIAAFHSLRGPAAGTLLKVRFKVTAIRQIVSATICEQCFTFKKPDRGSRLLLHREFVEALKPLILICVKALELKGYKAK